MGRRVAVLFLVVSTFMTALIASAFAKHESLPFTHLLGTTPRETFEIPPHLGGGFRECYTLQASFENVVSKVRRELLPRGWQEISIRKAPGHTLFADGIREVQVLQGKVDGGVALRTAETRLAARSLAWTPQTEWVSVVFDSPSQHPLDQTRAVLHDLRDQL